MNNLNSVLIEGNLVRDPLLRSTAKGTPVCTFSIASSRFYKGDGGLEKEVSFIDVEAQSKLAESCQRLGCKGRGVRVVGRLRQDRWTDADGRKHSKISVAAEHVEFRPESCCLRTDDRDDEYVSDEVPLDEVPEPEAQSGTQKRKGTKRRSE
jgi:single-strand DNA-binding protein